MGFCAVWSNTIYDLVSTNYVCCCTLPPHLEDYAVMEDILKQMIDEARDALEEDNVFGNLDIGGRISTSFLDGRLASLKELQARVDRQREEDIQAMSEGCI